MNYYCLVEITRLRRLAAVLKSQVSLEDGSFITGDRIKTTYSTREQILPCDRVELT